MRTRPALATAAAAASLSLAFGVVATGPAAAATTPTKAAAGPKITIKNFAFGPAKLKAKAGQTLAVTNADGAPHTLTADKGAFDLGTISARKSATLKLTKKGTFTFHCNFHPSMTGSITVS